MTDIYSTCNMLPLSQFLEDKLTLEEQDRLESHLDYCDECCDRLRKMTAAPGQWSEVKQRLGDADFDELITGSNLEPLSFSLDFLQPTDDPHMLGRFAGYEITGVIGAGGMGIVLKGFDRALNRYVAIKVLLPHYACSAAARQRFAREAQAAAAVVHENVIGIFGVSVEENAAILPFLVMPYVRGESLQKRLDRCGMLSIQEILRISIQIASGLAAAHEQGLVHRDIKPANILLPEDVDRVTITDFGLARAADDASLTRTGVVAGTPQYMSPEQAEGGRVTSQSDLFSLGSVMYTMCTGRAPFRAETPLGVLRRIVDEKPRRIQEINPKIPQWLCQIISSLHAKSPESRPQHTKEVASILKDCLAHIQQPISSPLPQVVFGKPLISTQSKTNEVLNHGKLKGVIAVIGTLTILLLGFFYWPVNQGSEASHSSNAKNLEGTQDAAQTHKPYQKEFVLSFANPDKIGELDVDIKRGDIVVSGYDGKKVIVKLTVPNFEAKSKGSSEGLSPIRANNPDFDITKSGNSIKVDSSANQYTTNLEIKVPHEINLILDSYRDGVIKVSGVSGELNLRSQNNDISLTDVSGSARVWSYNGSFVASFNSVTKGKPLYFESYNGSMDIALPSNLVATTRFRTGTGKLLTDFDVEIQQESVQQVVKDNGDIVFKFDEFVNGKIYGGGPLLTIETEKGDVRLRKRMLETELQAAVHSMHPQDASGTSTTSNELAVMAARQKTFDNIRSFVEKDQMPEYLLHAAHAGLLEIQRELAIKQLEFEQVYKIEAQLMLDYEKAIQSYEAMMENESWQKRFPAMDLQDTAPYRRRLNFLKDELAARQKRNSSESGQDRKLGDKINKELGPKLGKEWNEKLGDKLGREWSDRLNRKSKGKDNDK